MCIVVIIAAGLLLVPPQHTAIATASVDASPAVDGPLRCDVLVAGGSTAALSTALTSAVAEPTLTTCLTEPTDELGGQLAFNPAIDYGIAPAQPSKEWASLVAAVTDARAPCWSQRAAIHLLGWLTGSAAGWRR